MCREAKEIQVARKPNNGDMVARYNLEYMRYDTAFVPINSVSIKFGKGCPLIWLPRIEDLMEILQGFIPYRDGSGRPAWGGDRIIMDKCLKFAKKNQSRFVKDGIKTAPELWLCFVMDSIYSKTWNSGTWA